MNRPPSVHLARGEHEVQHLVAKDEFHDRARCLLMIQHRVEADGRALSMVLDAGQRGLCSQPDANGFGIKRWKPRLNTGLQLPNIEIEQTQFGMSRTAGGMKNPAHERHSDRHRACFVAKLSSSINAVNFSFARATKRFPSSRCASAIQIVRPLESTAETQPQLHPDLLRLSAITSQFFIRFRAIALMIMSVGLNCGFEFEKGRQLLI
jgi:hypothetical protein